MFVAQLFAGGDADLFLHDIDAGDHLGHRMFDLHASVHFDEVEAPVFIEELEGTRTTIANPCAGIGADLADLRTLFVGDAGSRRFLDDLLVAALHRAVALAQEDGIAVFVGQHLDLDMARLFEELLHIHDRVAEGRLGFGAGHVHRIDQSGFAVYHAHAASATAAGRFDDDRETDFLGAAHDVCRVVAQCTVGTGYARYAGGDHRLLGGHLVAHQANGFRTRSDEDKTGLFDAFGKVGILGQEAIARMDGLGVGDFGCGDDGRDVQITFCRGGRSDADRFVGQLDVLGFAVGFGVNHNGFDAQFAAGALDTQSDFTAVGDQDFFKHGWIVHSEARETTRARISVVPCRFWPCRSGTYSMMNRGSPYSTGWPSVTRMALTVPARSASISFISFMASMMHRVSPTLTWLPTSTKFLAPGLGAR